jgi:hypothetical protein
MLYCKSSDTPNVVGIFDTAPFSGWMMLVWSRRTCTCVLGIKHSTHLRTEGEEGSQGHPSRILPDWIRKLVGQNEVFDVALWKDNSHRLQGRDLDFLPSLLYLLSRKGQTCCEWRSSWAWVMTTSYMAEIMYISCQCTTNAWQCCFYSTP